MDAFEAKMSCPSKSTLPEVGFCRALRCWISVDLPDPVWPMMPRISPFRISRFTSRTAASSKGVSGA